MLMYMIEHCGEILMLQFSTSLDLATINKSKNSLVILSMIAYLVYSLNSPCQVLTPLFIALVLCCQQCVATTNRILQWFVAIGLL